MMDGGALCNLVAQLGPIPEAALANMVFQILWALAYLKHDKRVHRDIKPGNLLINSRGEVKVTDFGVSAELQSSVQMCGTFVGTFKYMSPERIRNQPYNYASVGVCARACGRACGGRAGLLFLPALSCLVLSCLCLVSSCSDLPAPLPACLPACSLLFL